ncbi:polysaccharide pyruvyl transferase family protein [Niabella sp. CC-SYL272]|uniref:polysaccharide pyruvyl transferase family protein n=1 Tax=Niabella agricola TaxID=2891571 RepID=UPI001F337064|nr:polysaccharide pyruvyl transferase family protein [Niabella agricola]MCF3112117.1 polysaccharide pyruvyl transferase family protein [Niabella agricola]
MRIGVLTLPLHTNYGGNLQAYALMCILRDMGHEVCLINKRAAGIPRWKLPLAISKRLLLKYGFGKTDTAVFVEAKKKREYPVISQYTQPFIDKYIQPQTKAVYTTKRLSALAAEHRFDAIIVGSDQVWRTAYTSNIEDYFLGFLKGSHTRRIAYAASFGTEEWEYSVVQQKNCAKHLERFDAVSVRETRGVEFCKKYFHVKAQHVVDPTMLLDATRYLELTGPSQKQEGVLVYILDETADKTAVVEYVSLALDRPVFRVNAKTGDVKAALADRIAPPTENWIKGFYEADFIITDSFHACVFAILFKKPFLVYGNRRRGTARFESLLSMFCLRERLIFSSKEIPGAEIFKAINWQQVDQILEEKRTFSREFLKKALELR